MKSKQLKIGPESVQCPFCSKKFLPKGVSNLADRSEVQLYHATCLFCDHSVLLRIMRLPNGIASLGVITDLKSEDAVDVMSRPALAEFELLAFHEVLCAKNLSDLFFEKIVSPSIKDDLTK